MTAKANTFEGGTNGTAISAANSAGASGDACASPVIGAGGSAVFSTTAKAHGSLGLLITPGSGVVGYVPWTGYNSTTGVFRVYRTVVPSAPAAAEPIVRPVTSTTGTVWTLRLSNSNQYQIVDSGGAIKATSTTTAAAGDRIEASWTIATTTTGSVDLYIYSGISGAPNDSTGAATEHLSTTSANLGTTNWATVNVGKMNSDTWVAPQGWDDVAFADGTTTLLGPPSANVAPVADAGNGQTGIEPFATVQLDGSASSDSDGTIAVYAWTQTAGPSVALSSTSAQKPTFTAPPTLAGATLTFSLTVTDNLGSTSSADTVDVTVLPHTLWLITGATPSAAIRLSRITK